MSTQVTEAFAEQFGTTFLHLAQQKSSRLENAVKKEANIKGSSKSINRLGLRTAARRTTRHGDTPLNDQPHSTRYVDLFDWEDGDMIDEQDKLRMLIDPTSDYMTAMIAGMNRAKDQVIIDAAIGTARTSSGTASLPAGQIVTTAGGLTKAKIVSAREIFRTNEADNFNGEELYFVYHHNSMADILTDTTLTSGDFLAVQMLQEGKVANNWMGFTWIPSELLTEQSAGVRYNIAFAKSGMCLGIGENIKTELGKDPSKSFNWRAYCRMSLGAVRLEEEKVVLVEVDD